eukprot:NODE_28_length_38599_cov_0.791792.p16 type:complete len:152 gc:universal NODE_28_length_38599_cov_0.791792:11060-11515(+)
MLGKSLTDFLHCMNNATNSSTGWSPAKLVTRSTLPQTATIRNRNLPPSTCFPKEIVLNLCSRDGFAPNQRHCTALSRHVFISHDPPFNGRRKNKIKSRNEGTARSMTLRFSILRQIALIKGSCRPLTFTFKPNIARRTDEHHEYERVVLAS